jgi:hypothetical protein
MKKIYVAVLAYTGAITVETADSLYAEVYEAFKRKHEFVVQFAQQDSIISRCRNYMVRNFLNTDFTDMIFIDADVGFPMGALCNLAEYPVDIVGAAYPYREDPMRFPVGWIVERVGLYTDPATGLLEVESLPAGCLKMSRKVLETLISKHPELEYFEPSGGRAYALFEFTRVGKAFFGEDVSFCRLARSDGFKVWLAPDIDMTHTGHKVFKGNIGSWLLSRAA